MAIGLLTVSLGLPLSAYEQGTYLLFDIREDAVAAKDTSGRMVVAASVFKKTKPVTTQRGKKSEFEAEITSFRADGPDSVSTGIEILDDDKDGSKTKSTFGESKPASGGFFFSY